MSPEYTSASMHTGKRRMDSPLILSISLSSPRCKYAVKNKYSASTFWAVSCLAMSLGEARRSILSCWTCDGYDSVWERERAWI